MTISIAQIAVRTDSPSDCPRAADRTTALGSPGVRNRNRYASAFVTHQLSVSGLATRPTKRITPVRVSRIVNRNG